MIKTILTRTSLALLGFAVLLGLWTIASGTFAPDLPSPAQTWFELERKPDAGHYITQPFADRGGPDKGLLLLTLLSLGTVMKGYALALLVATPIGLLLGRSKFFAQVFDPVFQVLRPVSPLAWYPLGAVLFAKAGTQVNELGAMFTIAVCAMWPTVLNTAAGVRAVPQDYLNVARVLRLSPLKTLFRVLIPAALPQMFTGFRLSLGIAWLVIVAVEMLTGREGIGAFLWHQGYNSLLYSPIIVSILMIGMVGFILDRIMILIEVNVHHLLNLPAYLRRWIQHVRPVAAEPIEQPAAATDAA